jgi:hypothetical protein
VDKKDVVSVVFISDGADQNVLVATPYYMLDPDILVQKKSIMK